MTKTLRCRLCQYQTPISEDSPDTSVDTIVGHIAQLHPNDDPLKDPNIIALEGTVQP